MFIHKLSKYGLLLLAALVISSTLMASSHREAPLIANDPLADNTDLYAFRNPRNPRNIVIIANYVPMQLPHGGPNYYSFGENVRYEIHIDNDASKPGDEIIYRFTFSQKNEDPSTFFNIRLGKQNLKTTYVLEKSTNGGRTFIPILVNGNVPPPRIGDRSISSPVGLNTSYGDLFRAAYRRAHTGENVFCGTVDDPFFVDLGGIFDLGDAPRQDGAPRDGLACKNVSSIALEIPIRYLVKKGAGRQPDNILDSDFVIGVWASASRPRIRTLEPAGESYSGDWVQVSRLGMPLTNEAVIPVGMKDYWNSLTPYDELNDAVLDQYFYNPELALYMDDDLFGGAVPAFAPLRIQRNSLQSFDFGNGQDGLYGLKGSPAVAGTALDDAIFGELLLPGPGMPRSVDLWPAFHTGVPNFPPYQLATGKNGNPLAAGKPFINNFLPNGGDMLRLNMAVPPTPRNHPQFSSLGLIQAAVLGLTDPEYNSSSDLQFIPNMDGFPNGRRLEDDVTRIELQAVSGVVLAAIGLWYDDYTAGGDNPVTQDLLDVLTYSTGVEENDKGFIDGFPFVSLPFAGDGECGGVIAAPSANRTAASPLGLSAPAVGQKVMMGNYPNPFENQTTIRYQVDQPGLVNLAVFDVSGRRLEVLANSVQEAGEYQVDWNASNYPAGIYFARAEGADGQLLQVLKLVKFK
ncbi:MAG: DUF4331 family protein [Lewinellaceae bacterium]|nr:DUF4331 family protein [Phaeodactylibacter sp.]MCB9036747.1 DUF4331 family protein [Lewinellaceae bacterium]